MSVKATCEPTPAPSEHPSRPSFDVMQELNAVLQDSNVPRDHAEAKHLVRKKFIDANMNQSQALIRDDDRSISGHFDRSVASPAGYATETNAAHIIPFSINSNSDKACLPFPHRCTPCIDLPPSAIGLAQCRRWNVSGV